MMWPQWCVEVQREADGVARLAKLERDHKAYQTAQKNKKAENEQSKSKKRIETTKTHTIIKKSKEEQQIGYSFTEGSAF